MSICVESRAHLSNLGCRPSGDVMGLQQLRGLLGGGTAGPRGSSSCVAPSAWHWLGFRAATIWCPEQLWTSGQKEEASCCRPCLPFPTAELFLICRRCSDPGAIKYLTDVRIAIRLRCRRRARSPLALCPSSCFHGWVSWGPNGISCTCGLMPKGW